MEEPVELLGEKRSSMPRTTRGSDGHQDEVPRLDWLVLAVLQLLLDQRQYLSYTA